MIICNNPKLCTGCGACSVQCPRQCISMRENEEGFFYPIIDDEKCVNCGLCIKICPSNEPTAVKNRNQSDKCFAFQNSNSAILQDSSSGGFFTAAAMSILSAGGIVYAVVMDDSFHAQHVRIENNEGIEDARKSKYLQSKAWSVYKRVQEDIGNGKKVLFVGTPCQVAAIRKLTDSLDLFTIDLVCHGVASHKVVSAYLSSMSNNMKGTVSRLYFRYKPSAAIVGGVIMHIEFEDGREYNAASMQDAFMLGFNSNIFLRISCYHCPYAGVDRPGDVTIGDFWGLGTLGETKINQKPGVNFVKVNSDKGNQVIRMVNDNEFGIFEEHMLREAALRNRTLTVPMKYNPKRKDFFDRVGNEDFTKMIIRLTKTYILERKISSLRDRVLKLRRKIFGR